MRKVCGCYTAGHDPPFVCLFGPQGSSRFNHWPSAARSPWAASSAILATLATLAFLAKGRLGCAASRSAEGLHRRLKRKGFFILEGYAGCRATEMPLLIFILKSGELLR